MVHYHEKNNRKVSSFLDLTITKHIHSTLPYTLLVYQRAFRDLSKLNEKNTCALQQRDETHTEEQFHLNAQLFLRDILEKNKKFNNF